MAGGGDGHDPWDDPSLKGFKRYFNNKTQKGRANVAIATYAVLAVYIVYAKVYKSKKAPAPTNASDTCRCD
ncbi:unnamed protein product [Acanthoscelides obtectus]|uniref:Uncharacterized protein n=1 Tax=Acanthoscelides obtectus TaxID=200917 RepID=A0A9P0JVJ2_ACAOB|nr:unnamed protein product [Acanthoscelides obtectus]CAK1625209.1 hypothetical protein AOBTE_LOCUS3034 [Acanthoscelides obtectus]